MKNIRIIVPVIACLMLCLYVVGCGNATGGGGGGGGGTSTYTLTVTVTPDATWGTVEANPNLSNWTYTSGTTVELTATGLGGKTFSSWEGDATGASSSIPVNMTANKSIKAYFRAATTNRFILSIIVTPEGAGTVEVNPLQANYLDGDFVALSAEASSSAYIFDHWSGSLETTSSRETITMNDTKEVTAVFKNRYLLTVAVTPGGWGTVEPWGGTFTDGTVVSLTPTAIGSHAFHQWSGDLTGEANPGSITMNGNKNITAEFTTISISGHVSGGTGTVNAGIGAFTNSDFTGMFTFEVFVSPGAAFDYTLHDLPNGTYYVGGWRDNDGSGFDIGPTSGDLWGNYQITSYTGTPIIVNGSNATGKNFVFDHTM